MNAIIEAVRDIVRELLPKQDAPVGVWLAKVSLLFGSMLGTGGLLYLALADTEWAVNQGLNKVIQSPGQTVIDQVQRRRKIFAEMSKLVAADPNIYLVFILNAYDPDIETFNFKDISKNTSLLIRFSRLRNDIDYFAFSTLETTFEEKMKDAPKITGCRYGAISPSEMYIFRQILGTGFDSDWYGVCPITDKKVTTSVSLVFYKKALPVGDFNDAEYVFRQRFNSFTEEVRNVLYAPDRAYSSITTPLSAPQILPQGKTAQLDPFLEIIENFSNH